MATKRRTPRETPEYVSMLGRMIRGLGKRLGDGDPDDLAAAVALQADLDRVIRDAVATMREEHQFSWAQIAEALGTSPQAVQQKYGRRANVTRR